MGNAGNRGTQNDIYFPGTAGNNKTTSQFGRVGELGSKEKDAGINWGKGATRSIYSSHSNFSDNEAKYRNLLESRLWKGVPQLSEDQIKAFEAAHTGHQFIFVVKMPKFMTEGLYSETNLHQQAKNLKSIIERASTGFNGASDITAKDASMEDGGDRKLTHITGISKAQNNITLTLHDFAGLPVKNAIESWMTGTFDIKSEHGHYFGNLGIPGGWCLANHTAAILVVQTDPSWTVIQDAAYYYNMFPTSDPFDHFNWEKGEHELIDKLQIEFVCNEERSPAITYAAEKYMNNRILSLAQTSVFNSRQFVVYDFEKGSLSDVTNEDGMLDKQEYNQKVTAIGSKSVSLSDPTFVKQNWDYADAERTIKRSGVTLDGTQESTEPGVYNPPAGTEK